MHYTFLFLEYVDERFKSEKMPVPAALIIKPSQFKDTEENIPGKSVLNWGIKSYSQWIYEFHLVGLRWSRLYRVISNWINKLKRELFY